MTDKQAGSSLETPLSALKSSCFVDSGVDLDVSSTSCADASRLIGRVNGNLKGKRLFCEESFKRTAGRGPVSWIVFNGRLIALLVAFAVGLLIFKMVIVSIPYVNKDSVLEISRNAQVKLMQLIESVQESIRTAVWVVSLRRPLLAIASGVAVALFSCIFIHMDSRQPGVNPPSPFSPKTKERFRRNQAASVQLSYMTAFLVSICVAGLIYFDVYN